MISPQSAAIELLRRKEAARSLIAFTEYTHPRYVSAHHHRLIAEKLEAVERGDIKRLMIFMPPRHGKSELASRRFPAWFLGRNPHKQIITAGYGSDFAGEFGRDVRNIVASKDFSNVFKNVSLAADSKAKATWHTNHGGIYVAAGVGTGITGRGADLGLIDDPVKDRKDADSEIVREDIWKWYKSTFYTRLMPNAAIIVIQTRWHEDDLSGRLLEAMGDGGDQWEILDLPASSLNGEACPPDTEGAEALWPEWYPIASLQQIRNVIDGREWSALYQQRPTPDEGLYFKREWFTDNFYKSLPEGLSYYGASDYAVTENGGDYTEHGTAGFDYDGEMYVADWWSGKTTAEVWIDRQIDMILKRKPWVWAGETGPIRRSVEPFLKKRMKERKALCRLEWLPTIGDKAARLRSFQAMASMGRIHFPDRPWAHEVIDQLVAFPAGRHDDKADVCGLFGRILDQAWGVRPKQTVSKKQDPFRRPTLNEMLERHDRRNRKRVPTRL